MLVEYHLSYEVESNGEIEDIEGRLRATNPTTMDAVDVCPGPDCYGEGDVCYLHEDAA